MNNPEYYKCINTAGCDNQFTLNKIYKIRNSDDLEDILNFIDDRGEGNGWAGSNHEHFIPATKEDIIEIEEDYSQLIKLLKLCQI